jgi:hypothetical protein
MVTNSIDRRIQEVVDELMELVNSVDNPNPNKTIVTVLVGIGQLAIASEAKDLGDLAREHEWFKVMSSIGAGPIHPWQFLTFRHWVARSANSYAVAYRLLIRHDPPPRLG